jgi:hypothetical protein
MAHLLLLIKQIQITTKLHIMKTIRTIILSVLAAATVAVTAQDYPEEYLGLPGDNLNLYAVMDLFQQSETLEGFEQSLNDEETMINNLDLNGDNLIDYITVSDYVEGNIHTIVLRAALDRNEQQDVAVFVVEKLANNAVQIQLIGDEALYGPNYIVEPIYAETPNPGYTGKIYRRNVNVVTTSYYDIAAWPVIRFIYHPRYVVWRSSWYWGYYPRYWRPWRAHYWHYYYGYHYHWHNHYYSHYRHWNRYRCGYYQTYYHSHVRVYSPTVVANIHRGHYRTTYSRPDQRRAGEDYYARTASRSANRSGTVHARQGAQRTGASTSVTRSANVRGEQQNTRTALRSSSQRNANQGRSAAVQRSQSSQSRNAVQRSSSSVQRSQPSQSRNAVQRSSTKKSAPSVQCSTSRSSQSSSVQRSQPSQSRSAVQRSSSSKKSASTVQRSQPSQSRSAVQRSSSTKKSPPFVQRSTSRSSQSSSVQRSQPSQSRSAVQRSSSSKKSASTVQRSQPSKSRSSAQRSSSRKDSGSKRPSSSSRR